MSAALPDKVSTPGALATLVATAAMRAMLDLARARHPRSTV
jgi:hypothetical protein